MIIMRQRACILAILLALIAPGCLADETVKITVEPERILNENLVGVGWNIGPLWIPENVQDRKAFFDLLRDSGQPWIRVMFQYFEWEGRFDAGRFVPQNDDEDPWTSPRAFLEKDSAGFVWSTTKGLDSRLIALLDFCEENDVWVEVNNWDAELKKWLNEKYNKKETYSQPIRYEDYLKDADEFGENVAAFVYYLKTRANKGKGYDCVKYYALWNEPGGGVTDYTFVQVDFPGCLNLLHKTVRDHLLRYDELMGTSVSKQAQCIGLEGYPFWRNSPASGHAKNGWADLLGKGVLTYSEPPDGLPGEITQWPSGDPFMDIVSIHDYWSVLDYDARNPSPENHGTIESNLLKNQVGRSIQQIEQYDNDDQIESLFLGELGSHVYCQGEKGDAKYENSLYVVEAAIRALNVRGVKGVSRWGWNMHKGYAALSYPGCWWETEPKGVFHAIDVNYSPYTLITKYIKRGSNAVYAGVSGGVDDSSSEMTWPAVKAQRLWASAFISSEGKMTLVVINDSFLSKSLEIDLSALKPESETLLRRYEVSPGHTARIEPAEVLRFATGSSILRAQASPRSVSVYTEYE